MIERMPDSLTHEPEVEHVFSLVALQFVQFCLSLLAVLLGLFFFVLGPLEHGQIVGLVIWASLVPLTLLMQRLKLGCQGEAPFPR